MSINLLLKRSLGRQAAAVLAAGLVLFSCTGVKAGELFKDELREVAAKGDFLTLANWHDEGRERAAIEEAVREACIKKLGRGYEADSRLLKRAVIADMLEEEGLAAAADLEKASLKSIFSEYYYSIMELEGRPLAWAMYYGPRLEELRRRMKERL